MSKNNPIVSVIVPAYNAEKYIADAIRSVIDQTYKEWELLIIDDGSTDDTAKIVKSFSDARITMIQQKNGGVSSARNRGLDIAQGIYITFLDADDFLPENSLMCRVEYLEKNPDVDIVDGQIIVKDEQMKNDIRVYKPYYTGPLFPRLIRLDSRVFFGVCYMFKKDILCYLRFKDYVTHGEDLLFYMELSSSSLVQYSFTAEPVYWYRSGHTSAMINLQGLENGYIQIMIEVKNLKHVTFYNQLILHLKITKIMILSWFHQKEYLKAISSIKLLWAS